MQMKGSHLAVIGAQLVVFAGMLPSVTTWRAFAILAVGQLGTTLIALTGEPIQGRQTWTPEQREANAKK